MPTDHRTLRVALLGIVMSLLLAGCGGDPTPSGSTSSLTAPDSSAAADGTTTGRPSASPSPSGSDDPDGTTSGDPDVGDDDDRAPGDDTSQDGANDGLGASDGSGDGAGLEMPEAPEEAVDSLSELLEGVPTAPLVAAPLPRAASARGRLVTRFPLELRPTRASRVETSSMSPSGDRLQVALVASTSLAPADVLLAYRTRLAGRGLVEQAAPPATAGSQAAAFRRGRSTVTVSVAPQGAGTSYSVLASLHTGGE